MDQSGSGMLLSRTINGNSNQFHWSGYHTYLEEENGDAKYAFFNQTYVIGGYLSRFDLGDNHTLESTDDAHFYLHDEAGNVILITDNDGGIEARFEQDVWGNDLNGTFDNAPQHHPPSDGEIF